MDGGPFGGSRGTVGRSEPRRQPERQQPQPVAVHESQPVHQAVVAHRGTKGEKKSKRFLWLITSAIIGVALGVGGTVLWLTMQGSGGGTVNINSGEYQAVFFTNGQVYFGKLQAVNSQYMKLTDIFYLQSQSSGSSETSKNPQQTAADQNGNVQLIKLGNEIHGPEDAMTIAKDQVLFYENLKPDGKVSQSIARYKKSN